MLRYQAALTSVLAAAIVPAAFYGQDGLASLEQTLAETARALEVLSGIQDAAEANDPATVGFVRAVTEDPILDGRRRDERLVDLRNQVNLLQTELDVLEAPAFLVETTSDARGDVTLEDQLSGPQDIVLRSVTKGMSAATLASLEPPTRSEDENGTDGAPSTGRPDPHGDVGDGYSADPVAHARACYYARRYARCVQLVEHLPNDAEALFWTARAMEKLGRLDEAVTTMGRAADIAGDTPTGRRAKAELEFLEWRQTFLSDAPHLADKQEGGKQ